MPSPLKKSLLRRQRKTSPAIITIAVAAVIIAFIAVEYALYIHLSIKEIPVTPSTGETKEENPSIAVLPFYNLSDNKEDEYFSEGFTDDIIINLQKISHINVRS